MVLSNPYPKAALCILVIVLQCNCKTTALLAPPKLHYNFGVDTAYVSSEVITRYAFNNTQFECFNYNVLNTAQVGTASEITIQTPGVILKQKSIAAASKLYTTTFGDTNAVCRLRYAVARVSRHIGESLLYTVNNWFSKIKFNNKQSDKYRYTAYLGTLHYAGTTDSFRVVIIENVGWLTLRGQQLQVAPIRSGINDKGEEVAHDGGIKITSDDKMLAAITWFSFDQKIFIAADLSPDRKLALSAFLCLMLRNT
jgi:hypothetical protein